MESRGKRFIDLVQKAQENNSDKIENKIESNSAEIFMTIHDGSHKQQVLNGQISTDPSPTEFCGTKLVLATQEASNSSVNNNVDKDAIMLMDVDEGNIGYLFPQSSHGDVPLIFESDYFSNSQTPSERENRSDQTQGNLENGTEILLLTINGDGTQEEEVLHLQSSGDPEEFEISETDLVFANTVLVTKEISDRNIDVNEHHGSKTPIDEEILSDLCPLSLNEACPLINESENSNNSDEINNENCVGTSSRKRKTEKSNPNTFKRIHGLEYETKNGKSVSKKTMKPNPCLKRMQCPNECNSITEDVRTYLFKQFWRIPGLAGKHKFINNCISVGPVQRKRSKTLNLRKMTNTYKIFLPDEEFGKPVCKQFLMSTLSITIRFIRTVIAKYKDISKLDLSPVEKRSYRKLSTNMRIAIDKFIQSLPAVPSHYCRGSSTRKYLPSDLKSLVNIYTMYKTMQIEHGNNYIEYDAFIKIFRRDYNIDIHKPKKDKCEKCERFKHTAQDEKDEKKRNEYDLHLKQKENEKKKFLQDQKNAESDPSLLVASFDLQKVLNTPMGDNMLMGYYRKFATYNFTIYETYTKTGTCYLWSENNGKRGANEICCNLYKFLKEVDGRTNIKTVSLYCDNCPGQNKNHQMIAFLKYFSNTATNVNKIILTFLVSGHTYMPVDSMHAVIEKSIKNKTVWSFREWSTIIRNARKNPKPYDVVSQKFFDFYNWNGMVPKNSKIFTINKPRLEIKFKDMHQIILTKDCIKITKNDNTEHEVTFQTTICEPKIVYNGELPINEKKFKDLKQMCDKKIIPNEYNMDYLNLKTNEAVADVLSETDDEDEEEH